MATPKQFRRRGRWSLIIGVVFVALTFGAVYAFADTVTPDGDTVVLMGDQSSVNLGTVAPGQVLTPQTSFRLNCTGKSHPDQGQTLSLNFTLAQSNVPAGGSLSATNASIGPIPASWPDDTSGGGSTNCAATPETLQDNGNSGLTITAPLAPGGPYVYTVRWNFALSPADPDSGDDANAVIGSNTVVVYALTVSAPVNNPPTVDAGGNYQGGEGSEIALDGASASDPGGSVASSLWSIDSQSAGSCSLTNAASLTTATINCTDNGTAVVKLLVTDNLGATNSDTANVTINNVAPTVGQPTWLANPIDCQTSATLKDISFSDPGVNDNAWELNIDWGDSSTDYNDPNVASQGAQGNQSHTYTTPGGYTATVDVTDKDGDTGTKTSASLTVNQVYTVSFLQPLDASTPAKVIGNSVKKGRVVPVKAIITDACTGLPVTSGNVTIKVSPANFTVNATDAVETFSDAGSSSAGTTGFRYDATGGYWTYNLDTSGFGIGTPQQINVNVGAITAATNFAVITTTK